MEALILPSALPLLLLHNQVLLPTALLTLRVGRKNPRSVALLDELYQRPSTSLLVAAIPVLQQSRDELYTEADTSSEANSSSFANRIGTAARVLQLSRVVQTEEWVVLLEGLCRIEVQSLTPAAGSTSYDVVQVHQLELKPDTRPSLPKPEGNTAQLGKQLIASTKQLISLLAAQANWPSSKRMLELLDSIPTWRAADVVAAAVAMTAQDRLKVLEAVDHYTRVKVSTQLVQSSLSVVKDSTFSLKKGSSAISAPKLTASRQARAADDNDDEDEVAELQRRLQAADLPPEVLSAALKEIKRLRHSSPAHPGHAAAHAYLELIADLPWSKFAAQRGSGQGVPYANINLQQARAYLERAHHGLSKVKERIVEQLAVMRLLAGHARAPILCLLGPPGVGKTSMAQAVADVLQRPLVRIALGGVRDEAEVRGHRRTYIGALPGRIIQGLRKAGVRDAVVLLDEIDKLGRDARGDPASALLEVLDPEQNHAFVDTYLGLPFDLSACVFLATANRAADIPPALLDRLEVLHLSGYTLEEKVMIAKLHLMPKLLEQHGLGTGAVQVPDDCLQYIVDKYTREAGVRTLSRSLAAICRHVAVLAVRNWNEREEQTREAGNHILPDAGPNTPTRTPSTPEPEAEPFLPKGGHQSEAGPGGSMSRIVDSGHVSAQGEAGSRMFAAGGCGNSGHGLLAGQGGRWLDGNNLPAGKSGGRLGGNNLPAGQGGGRLASRGLPADPAGARPPAGSLARLSGLAARHLLPNRLAAQHSLPSPNIRNPRHPTVQPIPSAIPSRSPPTNASSQGHFAAENKQNRVCNSLQPLSVRHSTAPSHPASTPQHPEPANATQLVTRAAGRPRTFNAGVLDYTGMPPGPPYPPDLLDDLPRELPCVVVDIALIEAVLGPPRFVGVEVEERTGIPGVAAGLVWTAAGGMVQYIECCCTSRGQPGHVGRLLLTGQVGDVLHESALIALSWIRSRAQQLRLPLDSTADISMTSSPLPLQKSGLGKKKTDVHGGEEQQPLTQLSGKNLSVEYAERQYPSLRQFRGVSGEGAGQRPVQQPSTAAAGLAWKKSDVDRLGQHTHGVDRLVHEVDGSAHKVDSPALKVACLVHKIDCLTDGVDCPNEADCPARQVVCNTPIQQWHKSPGLEDVSYGNESSSCLKHGSCTPHHGSPTHDHASSCAEHDASSHQHSSSCHARAECSSISFEHGSNTCENGSICHKYGASMATCAIEQGTSGRGHDGRYQGNASRSHNQRMPCELDSFHQPGFANHVLRTSCRLPHRINPPSESAPPCAGISRPVPLDAQSPTRHDTQNHTQSHTQGYTPSPTESHTQSHKHRDAHRDTQSKMLVLGGAQHYPCWGNSHGESAPGMYDLASVPAHQCGSSDQLPRNKLSCRSKLHDARSYNLNGRSVYMEGPYGGDITDNRQGYYNGSSAMGWSRGVSRAAVTAQASNHVTGWDPGSEAGEREAMGGVMEVSNSALSWDIHVHFPAGGIPKDGPSAGITLAVALVSLLSDRCVRGDTAMTGELTLAGLVLPVGGVKEKLLAARQAGLKRVIIPAKNFPEAKADVPEAIRNDLQIIPVGRLEEVLVHAFDPPLQLSYSKL